MCCGSFGIGSEGHLIACAHCGQCFHPYCVNIKVSLAFLLKNFKFNRNRFLRFIMQATVHIFVLNSSDQQSSDDKGLALSRLYSLRRMWKERG